MRGTFEGGFPWIEIEIAGNSDSVHKVPVIVDTGYDGYLTLPYAAAFPIGLTLEGTGSGKIADGSFSPHLKCTGTIIYAEKRIRAIIDVQKDSRPLLGNSMLKDLDMVLIFDPVKGNVELQPVKK